MRNKKEIKYTGYWKLPIRYLLYYPILLPIGWVLFFIGCCIGNISDRLSLKIFDYLINIIAYFLTIIGDVNLYLTLKEK